MLGCLDTVDEYSQIRPAVVQGSEDAVPTCAKERKGYRDGDVKESVVNEGPARERKSIIKIGFSNSAHEYTQGKRRKSRVE